MSCVAAPTKLAVPVLLPSAQILKPAKAGEDGNVAKEGFGEWTQNDDEVEITFPFEDAVDKKKLRVDFRRQTVKVALAGVTTHELTLYSKVDVDNCTWTLDGGKSLVVTLEKAEPGVSWPRVTDSA